VPPVRARRTFWASVALGVVLVAVGVALVVSAYERTAGDGVPAVSYGEFGAVQLGCSSIFSSCESFDPTLWFAAGGAVMLAAAVPFAFAARRRTLS